MELELKKKKILQKKDSDWPRVGGPETSLRAADESAFFVTAGRHRHRFGRPEGYYYEEEEEEEEETGGCRGLGNKERMKSRQINKIQRRRTLRLRF